MQLPDHISGRQIRQIYIIFLRSPIVPNDWALDDLVHPNFDDMRGGELLLLELTLGGRSEVPPTIIFGVLFAAIIGADEYILDV